MYLQHTLWRTTKRVVSRPVVRRGGFGNGRERIRARSFSFLCFHACWGVGGTAWPCIVAPKFYNVAVCRGHGLWLSGRRLAAGVGGRRPWVGRRRVCATVHHGVGQGPIPCRCSLGWRKRAVLCAQRVRGEKQAFVCFPFCDSSASQHQDRHARHRRSCRRCSPAHTRRVHRWSASTSARRRARSRPVQTLWRWRRRRQRSQGSKHNGRRHVKTVPQAVRNGENARRDAQGAVQTVGHARAHRAALVGGHETRHGVHNAHLCHKDVGNRNLSLLKAAARCRRGRCGCRDPGHDGNAGGVLQSLGRRGAQHGHCLRRCGRLRGVERQECVGARGFHAAGASAACAARAADRVARDSHRARLARRRARAPGLRRRQSGAGARCWANTSGGLRRCDGWGQGCEQRRDARRGARRSARRSARSSARRDVGRWTRRNQWWRRAFCGRLIT